MKSITASLCAATMAISLAVPVNAGPLRMAIDSVPSKVINIQGTDYMGSSRGGPGIRHLPRQGREFRRGGRDRHHERIVRRGQHHYWRGHRGSRNYRPGYRRHGDWWFPAAAFLGGAIIGNVIASQPRAAPSGSSSAHVDWCYNRYRSYRASDNTFQPYNGPRRPCNSPYG